MSVDVALGHVDGAAITADAGAFVAVPSLTGSERTALEWLAQRAAELGLSVDLHAHDLTALRRHPDHPGEEAAREELWGLSVTLPAPAGSSGDVPRLALCGHVDVVPEGSEPWRHGAWSGAIEDGYVWGRGTVDMKAGVIAALHAMAALGAMADDDRPPVEVVLQAVGSEEDGGLGSFAALARDERFDACLIPEPTGFDVVCAQAGALTFEGVVHGVAAHAAHRLEGVSAIDRYLPIHAALAAYETTVNADVEHELMTALALPYPLVVGRLTAGEWSSTVPDRLRFKGRAPVRVGEAPQATRDAVAAAVLAAAGDAPVELSWPGGQFASGQTRSDDPFAALVHASVSAELGRSARYAGVPWGADLRLWTARGIPTVMVGPHGIERAHGVDERVAVEDLEAVARCVVRVAWAMGATGAGA